MVRSTNDVSSPCTAPNSAPGPCQNDTATLGSRAFRLSWPLEFQWTVEPQPGRSLTGQPGQPTSNTASRMLRSKSNRMAALPSPPAFHDRNSSPADSESPLPGR